MKRIALVLLLLFFGGGVRPAAADTIRPADVLRVAFSLPAPPQCVGGCDVILFSLALANNPVGPTSASLFDGSTLLGNFRTDTDCQTAGTCAAGVPSFIAQGSAYGLGSPVIDFASIRNGTIAGRLDFSVTTPTDVELGGRDTFVLIGHASQIGGTNSGSRATITSEAIISTTPEPSSLLLFMSGAATLVFRLRRKTATGR
jgi:hypothetical protein